MTIPILIAGDAVQIDWADSKGSIGWTHSPRLKRQPGYIKSIGYIVQMNDDCLTITSSRDIEGASLDDLSIPVGCILELTILPKEWSFGGSK